ncbi:MAG TPA: hypothetical protein ENK02_06030 [Planctomycetes bacterium]|nr:hypothetical protein [Planctomycetota bacterium]
MSPLAPQPKDRVLPLFGFPFWTLVRREIMRFMIVVVQTVVTPLVTAGLYLVIFVGGLGDRLHDVQEGVSYMQYLVPGLAMMGAMQHAFNNSASTILISKFQNNLVDLLVSPLTDLEIALAYSFASVTRGALVGILTWAVTLPFGGPIPAHPFLALFLLCMSCLGFSLLGVTAGVFATKFDDVARISTFIILPFTYLGAVFIPVARYPDWIEPAAFWNPLLYCIDGLRLAFLGRSEVSLSSSLSVILGSVVVTALLSMYAWKRSTSIRT